MDGIEGVGRLGLECGVGWMMFDSLEVLGFLSFFASGFVDGGGVSRGDSCGERSELISILTQDWLLWALDYGGRGFNVRREPRPERKRFVLG